jgi:hypothetical protein
MPIRRLSISAVQGSRNISLKDVLTAIGREKVLAREWRARNVEAAGTPQPAAALEEASDTGRPLSGQRLLELASSDVQLYEGTLVGTGPGTGSIEIQAIDGGHWDVEGDESLLRTFQQKFPDAEIIES